MTDHFVTMLITYLMAKNLMWLTANENKS